MNEISHTDRARITAIIARLISELAGGNPKLDRAVAELVSELLELCCRSQMSAVPDHGRAEYERALRLISEVDWLFTVRKSGNFFLIEAEFGTGFNSCHTPRPVSNA